jgi:hypothetical protein
LGLPTRSRVRILFAALVLAALAFAGGIAAASVSSGGGGSDHTAAADPKPADPKIAIYGDSLTLQASPYLTAISKAFGLRLVVRAFSGTAPCDFVAVLRKDLTDERPDLVMFAFSGNSVATCMLDTTGRPLTGDAVIAKYRADTEAAADMTTERHRPFLVASPPAPRGKMAIWKSLDDLYRQIATTHAGVQYVDAGQEIAPGGVFSPTQQCLPYETRIPQAERSCSGPDAKIPVRGADGGHFCGNTGPTAAVLCPTYSSGAMRYAVSLVTAAKLTLDSPAARPGM